MGGGGDFGANLKKNMDYNSLFVKGSHPLKITLLYKEKRERDEQEQLK